MSKASKFVTMRAGTRSRKTRRGMSLVELMIALTISVALLTATAFAVDASLKSYKANQEEALLMQQARVALTRISRSIRLSGAHSPVAADAVAAFKAGQIVSDSAIAMEDYEGNDFLYRFNSADETVTAEFGGKTYVLAHGVEAFSLRMEPMRSAEMSRIAGPHDLLKRATINITVRTTEKTAQTSESTNEHTISLSTSVAPRQNSW